MGKYLMLFSSEYSVKGRSEDIIFVVVWFVLIFLHVVEKKRALSNFLRLYFSNF